MWVGIISNTAKASLRWVFSIYHALYNLELQKVVSLLILGATTIHLSNDVIFGSNSDIYEVESDTNLTMDFSSKMHRTQTVAPI